MADSAFVLHRYPYRETGFLLRVFTRKDGLISLIKRGAKNPKSGYYSLLQCFQPLKIDYRLRGELGTLIAAEREAEAVNLSSNALYSAFYLNELLLALIVAHDPQAAIFDLYAETLKRLDMHLDLSLRIFELNLLKHLGYLPDLSIDELGHPIQEQQDYILLPGHLPRISGERQNTASSVFQGVDLNNIHLGQWTESSLKAAKHLCRMLIQAYTRGKTFKSREIFAASLDVTLNK